MSCQLAQLAKLTDVKTTKKYLFPEESEKPATDDFDGWEDSDWGWKDEEKETTEVETESMAWLQECQVSLSPACELMALAFNDRMVLLAQKYNGEEDYIQIRYSLVFEGSVKQEENEKITCILCVPLASQKRSTHGGPDWTCVFVGFSSGYVRMYTENGTLLLSQLFSEEPVVSIKCHTYEPPRHSADIEKSEELNILYKKSLVSIDGFSLFQSLRACRNHVARATASGADSIQPPPLAYKKWGLQDHEYVADQTSCGTLPPNPFDQMVTASMIGGYNATIRPTPPASHLYLTTGRTPYTGFYYIIEGSTQPMLSDVAHAVASRLKSALFNQISFASGWFGLGGNKQTPDVAKEKKRPKIEPATSITARYGLHDKRRNGESVHLAPDNRMAATTDSFGRVILFDIIRGVAVRIWKGYRDAQIAWVEVKEDTAVDKDQTSPTSHLRRAIFLVIYAPRRGILEVWTAQQGSRVAAFNVSKWCIILSPTYGMMGLNNATYRDVKISLHHLYLIDPEGAVKVLDIPFHLALSDKNSKRARDQHLLKKLKILLKESTEDSESLQKEITRLLFDIKISSLRQQALERVLLTKYLSVESLEPIIDSVLQQLETQAKDVEEPQLNDAENVKPDSSENLDYESKALMYFCEAEKHLIKTYSALHALSVDVREKNGPTDMENVAEKLTKLLDVHPSEISQIKTDMEKYESIVGEHSCVSFEADLTMTVVEFLSCFECQMHKDEKSETGVHMTVKVQSALSESRKMKLANFLFRAVMESGTSSDYNLLLRNSHILPENLIEMLIDLWLSEETRRLSDAVSLHSVVKSITVLKDIREVCGEHWKVSPWWSHMREKLMRSSRISSALVAALVARNVAMQIAKSHVPEEQMETDDQTVNPLVKWESVTLDKTQWTDLVKQLEDLLALQCLLKMKPTPSEYGGTAQWQSETVHVTVKKVLEGGRGVIPEVVAKWIASCVITPNLLSTHHSNTEVCKDCSLHDASPTSAEHSLQPIDSPVVSQLRAVQSRLPFSLDSDILMANCAWEYMVIWNKDPEVILPMELALSFVKCIQNGALQHGVSVMLWQMFIVKKFSAAALLMEKVGKAPKDRLCRKDVGLSEMSLEKFLKNVVDLLDLIIQCAQESGDLPVLNVEDLWQNIQGPTSLAELALEQKTCNVPLVKHHYGLCIILYAVLAFSMRSVKPLSLYETKGRNAFFRPLQSNASLPTSPPDESLISSRNQFLCRVLSGTAQTLGTSGSDSGSGSTHRLPAQSSNYSCWVHLALNLARQLTLDVDDLNRHLCCELYSIAWDKLAEEVLLTVNNHEDIGSQLLVICGKRLHHFMFQTESSHDEVDKLSKCSTTLSTWLKSLDSSQLHNPDPPISDTATLVGHVVNHLAEGHSEYKLAIEMVELLQGFL